MLIKMNAVFYLFVVLCWTNSQATAATLSNNKELPRKKVSDTFSQPNSKSDGALPILHVVFDIASEENVETDSTVFDDNLSIVIIQHLKKLFNTLAF